jgi:Raf kinase inhibitor-like YbhB/YbcL family protein
MRKEMFDMMVLRSSAFEDRQTMPPRYGKKGENVSPPLSWENVPQGTKSFALAVVDRHPVARNFVHWLVIDMSADVTSLEEGASGRALMPAGSRELKVYGGPNPPSGSHDYEFSLYALKTDKLDLPEKVSLETFTKAVEQSSLATAKLVGKFARNRDR